MKKLSIYFRRHGRLIIWCLVLGAGILAVMLYRLGAVLPVAGPREHITIDATQLGWSHVLNYPFDLPLTVVRQLVHYLANGDSSLAVERLPSVIFGLMTIGLFAVLIKFWHGTRTALIATVLFACNAWLLHVSRQDTMDILYLWAVPLLLVMQLLMHKYGMHGFVFYGSLAVCGLLLYVPGLVWFVLLSLFWQRKSIRQGWQHFKPWWQRVLYILVGIVWLPLLIRHLTNFAALKAWLGFPTHLTLIQFGRQLAFVPVHAFVRGPDDPQRWLGHAPLLDAFSLIVVLLGLWFYLRHLKFTRSRLLASYWLLAILMGGLGGAAYLSLVVPLLYIFAATGIAYLLHEWLRVFPLNPVARKLGIGLVVVAVAVSCSYNLRAYYVAWPHNAATQTAFRAPPTTLIY